MPKRTRSASRWARRFSELQNRLTEAEDTLNAIRNGAVDALVVRTPRGEQLFTLKGADQTYRALVEGMNEGAVTVRRGTISYCNNRFAQMSGAPMEKVIGASIFDFIEGPGVASMIKRVEKRAAAAGTLEAAFRTADGTWLPVLISASRFLSDDVPMVSIVLTDISAQKEAQEARQELSRKIINAQEQERQRVARDLHDSVNQLLSTAKYRLGSLAGHLPNRAGTESVSKVQDVIERALSEVRSISRNLRPSELDDLGLAAALRSLGREFSERAGMKVQFSDESANGALRIPKEVEVTVYRIAQEALNNVEKHSEASRVAISVRRPDADLVLTVSDNGRGFEPEERKKKGWGLQNIIERAGLLSGSVEIASATGRGTMISVKIPLTGRTDRKPVA